MKPEPGIRCHCGRRAELTHSIQVEDSGWVPSSSEDAGDRLSDRGLTNSPTAREEQRLRAQMCNSSAIRAG